MALMFVLVLLSIWTLPVSAVLPMSLGCSSDIAEQPIIRCRSNNLDYIVKSMYILVPEPSEVTVNGTEEKNNRTIPTIEPREVDIFYCDVPELSNIFVRFNHSLERIRVARSNVQMVNINAFEGLGKKLRNLDLSGNKLRTVPLAIQNLTSLEVLNLRDNKIQLIAEGPTFTNMKHLRELYLSYNSLGIIDNSKLQLYPSVPNNRKSNQQTPIGLTVFNLGNITSSLEILSLRGNGMHSYPEQLMVDFPRLKSLDLSFNSLIELPEDAFRTLPELQILHLDSNFIRKLKLTSMPETLKLFTMKNNPIRCDCDVKWLLDLLFRNKNMTLLLPKCHAPFHLRETSFLRLTAEKLCNESHSSRETIYVTDRDLSYFPMGVFQSFKLLDIRGEYRSIFVSWSVDVQFYYTKREWVIIYRKMNLKDNIHNFNRTVFASTSYIENQTDWTTVERIFSDSIRNLTGGSFYQVCMAVLENNINYVHLNHCGVAQTEKEAVPSFTALEPTPGVQTTTVPPDPDYLIESNFSEIRSESRAITVYWNVVVQSRQSRTFYAERKAANVSSSSSFTVPESPLVVNTLTSIYNELKWKISYRKFATSTSTEVTIMKNNYIVKGPNTHQYTIANLKPDTGYTVCFETVNDLANKGNRLMEFGDGGTPKVVALDSNAAVCKEVETPAETTFPSTEVAIASTISVAATAVIATVFFCLFPRVFKKKKNSKSDPENTSQVTTNTETGNTDDYDDDDDDNDMDSSDDEEGNENKPNGHGPKWKKDSYPRITSIFPTEGYRNGVYHSSLRNFNNGIPPFPAYQRNGTYPKSILKKSPSAPTLSEAMKPIPILKRPSSVEEPSPRRQRAEQTVMTSPSLTSTAPVSQDRLELPQPKPRKAEVEMKKIFTTQSSTDSESEMEKQSSFST